MAFSNVSPKFSEFLVILKKTRRKNLKICPKMAKFGQIFPKRGQGAEGAPPLGGRTTGSRCDKILPGVFTDCHYVTSHHKGIRKDVAWSFWNFDCTFSRKLRCGGRKKFKIPYDLKNRIFQSLSDFLVSSTIRRVSASAFQICFQI